TGRAMRRGKGKKYGYIIVPIVMPDGADLDEYAESTAFVSIMRGLRALSVYDKRIVEELSALQYGRVPRRGKRIIFTGKVPVGLKMSLAKLERAIKLKMWESVGRINMRSFEEAREWARQLGLQSVRQWEALGPKRPADIPSSPQSFYANNGWKGWGDFL